MWTSHQVQRQERLSCTTSTQASHPNPSSWPRLHRSVHQPTNPNSHTGMLKFLARFEMSLAPPEEGDNLDQSKKQFLSTESMCFLQAIQQLKFSHFRQSLLGAASDDGAVNLWDTNKRLLLHSFPAHKGTSLLLGRTASARGAGFTSHHAVVVKGRCPRPHSSHEVTSTAKASDVFLLRKNCGPHPHWKQHGSCNAQCNKMEPGPDCAPHMLLSVQCVQDLLQKDLRILICFASRVASSVDEAVTFHIAG